MAQLEASSVVLNRTMDYRKPTTEPSPYLLQSVEVWGEPVSVISMCRPLEVFRVLDESKKAQLYGLASGTKMYLWDAFDATHSDIMEALQLGGDQMVINRSQDGTVLVESSGALNEAAGNFLRLISSPNVFCLNENYKWVRHQAS